MHKYLILLIVILLSINYVAIAIDYSTLYYWAPNSTIERYGYKNPLYLNMNRGLNIGNHKYPNQNNRINSRKQYIKTRKKQKYIKEPKIYGYYWF